MSLNPQPLSALLAKVRACRLCEAALPQAPSPILQAAGGARILIAGQAPGRITQARGIPFDDASGERLRRWLGVDRVRFYDANTFAIVPMGFCFPGTGAGGDLPPRPECATTWRAQLLAALPRIELTLVIGQYALDWHLPAGKPGPLSARIADWRRHWPAVLPMPHPSPRNNRWLKTNPWFEADVLPVLQARVATLLD